LLQRKPNQRLGLNGPLEVKSHPWFDDFPWHKLDSKELQAPFVPEQVDNFDVKVTNDSWKDEDTDKMKESAILLRRDTVQDLFKGYYYDQSFEGFSFSIEEKPKPEQPQPTRRAAHRSLQLSSKSTIVNNSNSRSNSKQSNDSDVKNIALFATKRESQQIMQNYQPISLQKEVLKNQSRNIINLKVPDKKQALPKGPFHYKNESKKISQI